MAVLANSLGVRAAAITLGGLVLFNLVMGVALFAPIGRQRAELFVLPLPSQAAAIVNLLEATPPEGRARVLDALNSPGLIVRLLDRLPPPLAKPAPSAVKTVLEGYDRVFADHEFQFDLRRFKPIQRLLAGEKARDWVPVRLFVHLHSGPYVVLEPARAALLDSFIARGLVTAGLVGVALMVALCLAIRQTTRPVALLADSARALADRLDVPDLAETGPRELRDLAAAFNHMKGKIRQLVGERTRVLAAIAHDLRTYLTRLRLRADFITDPDQRARAERDLDEMAALIDDTLLFAREAAQGGPENARADIGAEVSALLAARSELGEPLALTAPVPEGAIAAIDPLALRRILANLIDNALRYGGSARLSVCASEKDWLVQVEDDGPGIPEVELERVTAPFERLEPSRGRAGGGAGLGLAIVRALTESQGGTLRLSNRSSGGLCAEIRLKSAAAA